MTTALDYFSRDYLEARGKFRQATQNAQQKLTHVVVPYPTIDDLTVDDLTVDIAVYEHKGDKKNLLVILSGVHGVEGYVGSAVQLMFADKYLSKVNSDTGVALYHAFNPFGFHNNRRVNEKNIDCNRGSRPTIIFLTSKQK